MKRIPQKSLRILIKAVLLFVVFNYAFNFVPDAALWKISLYNTILPGKTRFPLEKDLDLMFGVHEIANSPQHTNEYKVFVLGDSATWGENLDPDETFSSVINASNPVTCQAQPVHVYNLGYPGPSVLKDKLILQKALTYQPDLIVWNITLNSMFKDVQAANDNVIVRKNAKLTRELNNQSGISLVNFFVTSQTFWDRKDGIARFIRMQLDDIRWQSIGGEIVDKRYKPVRMNLKASRVFEQFNLVPPTLDPNSLHFDLLRASVKMAGNTPIIFINEPTQIVTGPNSDIRYSVMYPRWVYDQYHAMLTAQAQQNHWNFADLWNIVPPTFFSDSVFHRTPQGEKIFAERIKELILKSACP